MDKQCEKNDKNDSYTYYFADGTRCKLTEKDVALKWIELLHEYDKEAFAAERRERYHTPIKYSGWNEDSAESDNPYLADTESELSWSGREKRRVTAQKAARVRKEAEKLSDDERLLFRNKFIKGHTVKQLAEADGISVTAMAKRVRRLQEKLKAGEEE